jgi:hypothetical protein
MAFLRDEATHAAQPDDPDAAFVLTERENALYWHGFDTGQWRQTDADTHEHAAQMWRREFVALSNGLPSTRR